MDLVRLLQVLDHHVVYDPTYDAIELSMILIIFVIPIITVIVLIIIFANNKKKGKDNNIKNGDNS